MGKPVIANGHTLVTVQPPCVRASFYRPGENRFFAIAAADDRGALYALDYESARPNLVEIVHSEAHAIRGNHVHRHCTETFSVLSGEVSMFLLCACPGLHLWEARMAAGTTVRIDPGTPHTIFARTKNEGVAAYTDGDPRRDRVRVMLLEY